MKKTLIILSILATAFQALGQKIVVKAATLCFRLQKEAETVHEKMSGNSVTVVGGGSGVGIAALMDGTTDIAMSSDD